MKIIVEENAGCAEEIKIEYTPTEALIINHAMRRYACDEDVSTNNRGIMERMLETEPIFMDKAEEYDDAISRKAVLDLIEHYNSDGLGSVFYGYEEGMKFADAVNKLPPVNPQESKTERIEYGTDGNSYKLTISNGKEFEQEPLNDILDKIEAEVINAQLVGYATVNGKREIARKAVLDIIDKYKTESEESMMIDGYVAEILNNQIMNEINAKKALKQEPLTDVLDKITDEVCDIDDKIVLNPDSLYERKVYVRFNKVIEIIGKYRGIQNE